MSNHEAATKLRPKNRSDWRRLMILSGCFILVIVFVATLLFLKQRHRQDIEANWESSIATIEDVRVQEVGLFESSRGGTMLYNVQVFAKYDVDGATKERWITIQQRPVNGAWAKLQASRWKGQKCFVRWKPGSPDQAIADVS
jgi:hypothetical protein